MQRCQRKLWQPQSLNKCEGVHGVLSSSMQNQYPRWLHHLFIHLNLCHTKYRLVFIIFVPVHYIKSSLTSSSPYKINAWEGLYWLIESIQCLFQMVLATSVLENMIKSEFLKNDWWYWSSFTVAIKTSTASSLALRIYTLDHSIVYTKEPNTVPPADSTKVVNKGRKGKEPEPSSS